MTDYITGVKNPLPFYYFEKISKIPRGSGNEDAVCDYLVKFARERGLYVSRDEHNNVLIKKAAARGREKEPTILLQAHTDMVCEKNEATEHDFLNDEIKLVQIGNVLMADNTTLGADDGFGVALMLAVLDDNSLSIPNIECLFTSREEIGLVGATLFDYSKIGAGYLINLDSAEEDTVIIGCCGGIRTELTLPVSFSEAEGYGYSIEIGGLCGGHSGEDIDKGRLNSNILMGSILSSIKSYTPIRISNISGGDKDNAIPRECRCIFIADRSIDAIIDSIASEAKSKVIAREDGDICVEIRKCDTSSAVSYENTDKIIKALSIRNGVLRYRDIAPVLPEVSRNLARIRTSTNNISIGFSSRSYKADSLNFAADEIKDLATNMGASAYHHEAYPGWESDRSSSLVKAWSDAYEKIKGGAPDITLIHAGLECGVITSRIQGMEGISVGCNVHNLHTPKESMEIDSFDRVYEIAVEFLKKGVI